MLAPHDRKDAQFGVIGFAPENVFDAFKFLAGEVMLLDKFRSYDWFVHRNIQIQTSASAEQTLPYDWDSDDYDLVAAVLFQVALGSGIIHRRLAAAVYWSRH